MSGTPRSAASFTMVGSERNAADRHHGAQSQNQHRHEPLPSYLVQAHPHCVQEQDKGQAEDGHYFQ
jgi:hypothetical protein